jgi:Flp pilus assembly protein TadD
LPAVLTQDRRHPLQLAERAVAGEQKFFGPNWRYRSTLGLALYRAGRLDSAQRRVRESMAASPDGDRGANHLLLALIHGRSDEGRRWLRHGLQWRTDEATDWRDRLLYRLLRQEALARIETLRSSGE